MNDPRVFELLVGWLIDQAGSNDRVSIAEEQVISFLQDELNIDRVGAMVEWQALAPLFRKSEIVRDGYLVQWNIFRGVVEVRKLATAEEIQSTAQLYELTTTDEVARKIRSLTGLEFEHFLTAVLSRLSEYRNITVTQASRDGGIDFRGYYVPTNLQQTPLIGQAKQVSAPVSASTARDFIGALDTAGEQRAFGLFVSTGGFTDAAILALEKSRYHIMRWDMKDILAFSRGIATCRVDVSFEVPDEAFWNEVIGSA